LVIAGLFSEFRCWELASASQHLAFRIVPTKRLSKHYLLKLEFCKL